MTQFYGKIVLTDQKLNVSTCDNEEGYRKIVETCKHTAELIGGLDKMQEIKPIFDIDAYDNDIDLNAEITRIQQLFPNKEINVAVREPRVYNGRMKYSYRLYVDGVKIKMINMPEVMKSLKIDKNPNYDNGLYSKNRFLYTPLTSEKVGEKPWEYIEAPPLVPKNGGIFGCCASYVLEDFDSSLDDMYDMLRVREQKKAKAEPEFNEPECENEEKWETFKKHIDRLTGDRADDYCTWSTMVWCIIGICERENIGMSKCLNMVHQFSKKSQKYNDAEVDNFFEKNYGTRDGMPMKGWSYFYECLKEDDMAYYQSFTTKTYNQLKIDFEKTHCKILYPPMICIAREGKEHLTYKMTQCKEIYDHLKCKLMKVVRGKDVWEEKDFITIWLKDKNIRRYDVIVFKPPPLHCKENEYNTWVNFDVTAGPRIERDYVVCPTKNIKIERDYFAEYCQYLNNLVSKEEIANYILARYAQRIQEPAYRSEVCLILYGSEGDGKNMLLQPIYKIMGKYALGLDDANKLYEKHAQYESEKLFICINEVNGTANFNNCEVLKSRITEKELWINPKGKDAYCVDNRVDYDMTTNNMNVVKLTDTSYRRFFQVETTSFYQGNATFFNDYHKDIVENPVAIKQIYDGLMAFDVKKIVPSGNFQAHKPVTEVSLAVKRQNRDKLLYFIEELVSTKLDKVTFKLTNKEFFAKWNEWLSSNKVTFEYNSIQFGQKVTNLLKKQMNVKGVECIKRDSNNKMNMFYVEALKKFFAELNGEELSKPAQHYVVDSDEDE